MLVFVGTEGGMSGGQGETTNSSLGVTGIYSWDGILRKRRLRNQHLVHRSEGARGALEAVISRADKHVALLDRLTRITASISQRMSMVSKRYFP